MSAQGDRQAAVRALTGTAWTYEGDWHALFDQAGIPAGSYNGRLLAWINQSLGTSYTEINGAMQAYATAQGAANWSSMGTIGGAPVLNNLLLSSTSFSAGGSAGDVLAAITGQTSGSTLSITPSDTSNMFAISGSNLVKGLGWPAAAASAPTVSIRETLPGAPNSPKDNTFAATIAEAAVFLPATTGTRAATYSVVQLVSSYAGPLFQIIKPSDGTTTMDVYPKAGSRLPDYSAIDTFTGGVEPAVSIWYDQDGVTASNATQTTAANRPVLANLTGSAENGIRPIRMCYLPDGATTTYMTFPNLGISCRASGVAFTTRMRTTNYSTVIYELYNAGAPVQNGFYNTDWAGLDYPASGMFQRANVTSVVETLGSGGTTFTMKGAQVSKAVFSATNGAQNQPGYIGHSTSTAFNGQIDYFSFVMFNTTPTTGDATAVQTALDNIFAPNPNGFYNQVIYGGSSLSVGVGSTNGRSSLFLMNLGDSWEQYAMGAGGKKLADGYTNRAVEIGLYSTGRHRIVHFIDAPHNDMQPVTYSSQTDAQTANAQSAQNIYNNYTLPLVAAIIAAGAKPAVPTMIAGSDITVANFKEYARLYYNTLVRTGAATYGYTVSDRALAQAPDTSTPFNVVPPASATTYYFNDGIHPNDVGYPIMSACDKAALLAAAA